jgi:hypothetical protein
MACKALPGLWHSRRSAMLAALAYAHGKIASVRFRPIADTRTLSQAGWVRSTIIVAATIATLCASSPALGCERDSDPIYKLPGETDQSAAIRGERIDADRRLVAQMQMERHYVEAAPRIYVGEVVSRLEDGSGTTVRPVKAYRGALPRSPVKLAFVPASLCTGDDISDGEGWRGKPGELVVIFDRLKPTANRPNGIDSLMATSIRSQVLSSWIEQFGTVVPSSDADGG